MAPHSAQANSLIRRHATQHETPSIAHKGRRDADALWITPAFIVL
jgi:hypothetical protein